ncbi:DUF6144 family protein [bacterium]
MERKDFLTGTFKFGIASWGMMLFHSKGKPSQTDDKHSEQEQKFKENWISTLMEHLEKHFNKKSRCELMETCGRECAKRGAVQIAQSCKNDVKKMTDYLGKYPDLNIELKDDSSLVVTYKRCLCELVSKGPDRLPDTYCECSRGWLLQMFEIAAQKPVRVSIIQTIKRGGEKCEFTVMI